MVTLFVSITYAVWWDQQRAEVSNRLSLPPADAHGKPCHSACVRQDQQTKARCKHVVVRSVMGSSMGTSVQCAAIDANMCVQCSAAINAKMDDRGSPYKHFFDCWDYVRQSK